MPGNMSLLSQEGPSDHPIGHWIILILKMRAQEPDQSDTGRQRWISSTTLVSGPHTRDLCIVHWFPILKGSYWSVPERAQVCRVSWQSLVINHHPAFP
jgi:hypothetical protein